MTSANVLRHTNLIVSEYASVGYIAKRIQMRKNRFLAMQKVAAEKKSEANSVESHPPAMPPQPTDHNGIPKQTVSVDSILG